MLIAASIVAVETAPSAASVQFRRFAVLGCIVCLFVFFLCVRLCEKMMQVSQRREIELATVQFSCAVSRKKRNDATFSALFLRVFASPEFANVVTKKSTSSKYKGTHDKVDGIVDNGNKRHRQHGTTSNELKRCVERCI